MRTMTIIAAISAAMAWLPGSEVAAQGGGMALSLDGDGDYMRIPFNSLLELSDELTIEGWVRFEDLSEGQAVFSREYSHDGLIDSYVLMVSHAGPQQLRNYLKTPEGSDSFAER